MKADAATEAAVRATLTTFADIYRQRDLDGLLALFAPDSDVLLIGTGADEWRVGATQLQAQAERDWAQSEAAAFELRWSSISGAGTVAWTAAEGIARVRAGGQEVAPQSA